LRWEGLCRHGLVSGVTGAGKTNTARLLAAAFSAHGVPVLALDAKGDFAGISQACPLSPSEAAAVGPGPPPVLLWDLQGRDGHRLELGGAPPVGAPAFPEAVFRRDAAGAGYVSVLAASELTRSASAYAQVVWDLALRVRAQLPPRASDAPFPLALLIEEAHLVFRQLAPPRLLAVLGDLGRKGVPVIFLSPDPADPPAALAARFGLWIQHALWTCTAPALEALQRCFGDEAGAGDLRESVRSLGIGEALVRTASDPVGRRLQLPISVGRCGPLTPGERRTLIANAAVAQGGTAPGRSDNTPRRRRGSRRPRPLRPGPRAYRRPAD
jgi:hypothetical protein